MHHLDDNTLLLLQLKAKTPLAHCAQFNCPFFQRLSTTPSHNPRIRRDRDQATPLHPHNGSTPHHPRLHGSPPRAAVPHGHPQHGDGRAPKVPFADQHSRRACRFSRRQDQDLPHLSLESRRAFLQAADADVHA